MASKTEAQQARGGSRRDVYADVTNRMIAALEAGTVPWHKPWRPGAGRPRSMSTGQPYRGVNVLLLGLTAGERGYASPWWGTFRQVQDRGGNVRRGENRENGRGATQVVLWRDVESKREIDPDTGEPKRYGYYTSFSVFNAEQCEGLGAEFYPQPRQPSELEVIAAAEEITAGYLAAPGAPTLEHDGGNRAYYVPAQDAIHLPVPGAFDSGPHYYATTFHELAHSTGHATRLNRPGITDKGSEFGCGDYSHEELVAEMGAAMLAAQAGTDENVFDNSASYVASWLHRLEDDKKLVIPAAREAMAAADRVLEPSREAQVEPDVDRSADIEAA